MVGFEHRGEHLQRGVEGVCGAWSVVQAVCDDVEVGLGVDRKIGALGQVLAQQPVGVLADAALPGAVGVAEVDLHVRTGGEPAMPRHLLALVVGQAVAHRLGYRIQLGSKARQRRSSRRVVHSGQQHKAAGALHEHAHSGIVASALDEVDLPVARHEAVLDLGRTHVDTGHLRDLPTPVDATLARHAGAATMAQAGDELPAQLAAWVHVDRRVDRLVRDMHGWVLGPHALEDTGGLLRRPLPH